VSLLLLALLGLQDAPITLRGRLWTDPAKEPEEGQLSIAGGKIVRLGAEGDAPTRPLPKDAWITAGIIDAHSSLGSAWDAEEPTEALTPHVRAVEGFSSRHPDVLAALSSGVTLVALAPGDGNVVGGRVGLVHLNGERYDRALRSASAGLKASISEPALRRDREPTSRSGALRLLRDFLRDRPADGPLLVRASTEGEIRAALGLGRPVVLVHAREAAKALDVLRASKAVVAFGPLTPDDPLEILETPGKLAQAGVPVALISDAPRTSEAQLRYAAILAVRAGMSPAQAWRALTTTPASIYGLPAGELKEGADADVVAWSGDPLSPASAVELVISRGRVTYRRESK
jgi:imidazolonepropionase-like amidohydrolase